MTANRRILASLVLGFGLSIVQAAGQGDGVTKESVADILSHHTEQLMTLPGVVAVGQGECDGRPCIKVFAAASSPELLAQLPKKIDGVGVELEISGAIKAR